MASVQEIRQRLRSQRIEVLRSRIEPLLAGRAGAEEWLFGSLARGDDPWWRGICRGAIPLHAWLRQALSDLALEVARAVVGFADQQLGELDGPPTT